MARFGGFGGGGMGGMNMQQMMKQAQKMQEQMQRAQEELEEAEVEGSAGGGVVTVKMNGKKRLTAISIKPEVIDPDDAEMLEDLITAAYNDAFARAEELEKEKSPMPGLM
jgi:DNA-binding YbaB/EbfC family protein